MPKNKRRKNDAYFTLPALTKALMDRVKFSGSIFECCAGDGAIANLLKAQYPHVYTNDIDKSFDCDDFVDATREDSWKTWEYANWCNSVVTNPPFSQAHLILPLAYKYAKFQVAMLLRLTYLEPCENRAEWLEAYPPNRVMVFGQPRPSFSGNGKHDSCTTAWMVWDKTSPNSFKWDFVYKWNKNDE